MNIEVGLKGEATVVVNEHNIAKTMKSGTLEVFATPAMCALMEEAAVALWPVDYRMVTVRWVFPSVFPTIRHRLWVLRFVRKRRYQLWMAVKSAMKWLLMKAILVLGRERTNDLSSTTKSS